MSTPGHHKVTTKRKIADVEERKRKLDELLVSANAADDNDDDDSEGGEEVEVVPVSPTKKQTTVAASSPKKTAVKKALPQAPARKVPAKQPATKAPAKKAVKKVQTPPTIESKSKPKPKPKLEPEDEEGDEEQDEEGEVQEASSAPKPKKQRNPTFASTCKKPAGFMDGINQCYETFRSYQNNTPDLAPTRKGAKTPKNGVYLKQKEFNAVRNMLDSLRVATPKVIKKQRATNNTTKNQRPITAEAADFINLTAQLVEENGYVLRNNKTIPTVDAGYGMLNFEITFIINTYAKIKGLSRTQKMVKENSKSGKVNASYTEVLIDPDETLTNLLGITKTTSLFKLQPLYNRYIFENTE